MTTRNAVAAMSLAVLLALGALVVWPFSSALAWAAIIAYVTWPVRERLAGRLPIAGLSALLMTVLVVAVLLLPLATISIALQREVAAAVEDMRAETVRGNVFATLRALPWIGDGLAEFLRSLQSPEVTQQMLEWIRDRAGRVFVIAGSLGRNALALLLMFLTLYFIYRDGDGWMDRLHQIVQRLFGPDGLDYLATVRAATRSVVYGVLAAALAQGAVAGIGFWFSGVPAPTLLALTTAVFALLPFGPALPIGAAVAWLALSGSPYAALALGLWGALAVGLIDNLLRPLVMAKGLHLHYLLALFGVLGGLLLFGLIGIFIGPILLAVLASLMRKWLGDAPAPSSRRRARR